MILGSLYIEAQGYVPMLLENLHGMSCSGTCLLGGAWFQCRYGGQGQQLGGATQGVVAAQAQEALEGLFHVEGQERWR